MTKIKKNIALSFIIFDASNVPNLVSNFQTVFGFSHADASPSWLLVSWECYISLFPNRSQ